MAKKSLPMGGYQAKGTLSSFQKPFFFSIPETNISSMLD